jgi:hypothetical protein
VSSTRGEVIRATAPVITAALALAVDERRNPGGIDVRRVDDATALLIDAARRLTELVDGLEPGDVPRAWRRDQERRSA